mmetsp:Transcript_5650/g.8679  ORF Transcript_5650/g.8679 Transcript_5650/m.8679 type:complete len:89 (+) Transcript_5650:424-690(+)
MAKESDLLALNTELTKLGSHYSQSLQNTTARIAAMESQVGAGNPPISPGSGTFSGMNLNNLELRVKAIEVMVASGTAPSANNASASGP